jgi:protocatechuate 3,4-dioxygenase alpha subunit
MPQTLDLLPETPSQTAGPYVHIGCLPNAAGIEGIYREDLGASPIREGAHGERLTIKGAIYDATGWAVRDAMLESWQADCHGRIPVTEGADPNVTGFARFAPSPETGEFAFHTVRPGRVTLRDGRVQAPHVSLWIVARGINVGLHTRIYFEDEENRGDPLLARIEQKHRIETLLARKSGAGEFRFDIRLGGAKETVFLDM